MAKRAVVIFGSFAFVIGILAVRVLTVNSGNYVQIANRNATRTIVVSKSRGQIYDCNLSSFTYTEKEYIAAVKPTDSALQALSGILDENELKAVSENVSAGVPQTVKVPSDNITCEDITVIETYKRYCDNQIAAHILGYVDSSGTEGLFGIEKGYDNLLSSAQGSISARFNVNATGRMLTGSEIIVENNNYNSKSGLCLTIDKNIQTIVENAMDNNSMVRGAVVVMDTATGEIKALASRSTFNPNNIAPSLDNDTTPFVNRAVSQYAVGSLFKAVVAASALENGIPEETTFFCNGSIKIGDTVFNCHDHKGHGNLDLKDALAESCNVYFINLIQQFNPEDVLTLAENLGFGQENYLCDGINSASGNLPSAESLSSLGITANLSFGQGELLATPVQLAAAFCAICSEGSYREPILLKGFVDENGNLYDEYQNKPPSRAMSPETANRIKDFLIFTVTDGLGKSAMPDVGGAGGKTATAQSGWTSEKKEIFHSWFCGFFPAENPQYVVTVFREDGISGSYDCSPVFKEIADNVVLKK